MPRPVSTPSKEPAIIELWARLAAVRRLVFTACPAAASNTGWAGRGEAEVRVEQGADGLRLYERGQFVRAASGRPLDFRNVYLWHVADRHIALWHERFGRAAAVWLFDLVPVATRALTAARPHACGADRYHAELRLADDGFDLDWSITGPAKNEALRYRYTIR